MRRRLVLLAAPGALSACITLERGEPLRVNLVGVDALPSQGLELRLAVKLRVQNPNDTPVDYAGISLELDVRGRNLASGVSDAKGSVPRFGETVLTVPVSVPASAMVWQVLGFSREGGGKVDYVARGRLAGGLFGGARFSSSGQFEGPGAK